MRPAELSSLLGEGWGDLVTFIVIAAFYLVGALAKVWANRDKDDKKEQNSTLRQMVQEAKHALSMEQTKQGDRQKRLSEWDRRQQALKQSQRQPPVLKPAASEQKPPAKTGHSGLAVSAKEQGGRKAEQPIMQAVYQRSPVVQRTVVSAAAKPVLQRQQQSLDKTEPIRPHIMGKSKTLRDASSFAKFLRSPGMLRKAVILKEILGPPMAMREPY
ncbi:MAG: hypothetical protein L0Y36_01980 [Planctomycetales bacterium]|nr:hypothetical protein [Planctomycetales bacterium]